MFRLFRALCFRRSMNQGDNAHWREERSSDEVKEAHARRTGGHGKRGDAPVESAADLTPELRSLALEALAQGLSSEWVEATDQEIDFYWRKELGISAEYVQFKA